MSRLPTLATWRVRVTRPPALLKRCPRCDETRAFVSSDKFRINAQGRRLDVWLIYKCERCDHTFKREVLARVSPESIPPPLYAAYLANDRQTALDAALAPYEGRMAPFDDFVVEVNRTDTNRARLFVPAQVSVRLDRVLARALGWSRREVVESLAAGRVRVEGLRLRPSAVVKDGWIVLLPLPPD